MWLPVGFLLGTILLQLAPALPAAPAQAAAVFLALVFAALARRLPRGAALCLLLAGALAGAAWAAWRGERALADTLIAAPRAHITLEGTVSGLPQRLPDGSLRFRLTDARATETETAHVPATLRLAWYAPRGRNAAPLPELHPGERWQFVARLKPPHGEANPGGWSYEQWLFESGIRATGTVRAKADNHRLHAFVPSAAAIIDRLRERVRSRFAHALAAAENDPAPCCAGLLTALAIGDQQALSAQDWRVFRHTGTAHLMSISGLHVSLVALFAALVLNALWRLLPARFVVRLSRRRAVTLAAWGAALLYTLLSGMGIAALRAFLMLSVAAVFLLSGRSFAPGRILLTAAFIVLLWQPWAALAPGFWLSFGAVAVILWCSVGRFQRRAAWREAVRLQVAICLASVPALLHFFGTFPLLSLIANLVAIPLVSFLITPLVLLCVLLPWDGLLTLAHLPAAWLMDWLNALANWPHALWQPARAPLWLTLATTLGIFWALLPRGTPARAVGLLACLPLLLYAPAPPPTGQARVTMLDVGQGLAVHVRTAHHNLLYDTGPAYGERDAGQNVLLPYFAAQGIRRLDALVLSHDDRDHTGGAASLLAAMPVARIDASFAPQNAAHRPCLAGTHWEWDGVRFAYLSPHSEEAPATTHDNDRSCLLRIRAADGTTLLLTGDIGEAQEAALLAQGAEFAADFVQAAHHGSAHSSSPAFVAATGARHVLISAGFHNAFGHPAEATLARWRARGAHIWRTDEEGAITFDLTQNANITSERRTHPRYWHPAPPNTPAN